MSPALKFSTSSREIPIFRVGQKVRRRQDVFAEFNIGPATQGALRHGYRNLSANEYDRWITEIGVTEKADRDLIYAYFAS